MNSKLAMAGFLLAASLGRSAVAEPSLYATDAGMATAPAAIPHWLSVDLKRQAAWLPLNIKHLGLDGAFELRWSSLPADVQGILVNQAIPHWLIALMPTQPSQQTEILKQLRFMTDLAGEPPASPIGQRFETLLLYAGAAQLPTPGDARTGMSLGAEGCTAAISKYILAELKLEYPRELKGLPDDLTNSQSSVQMEALLKKASSGSKSPLDISQRSFDRLTAEDVLPGSIMIAQKPGGTHVFGWTRVPSGWRWLPGDKMAIGNTGLAEFGAPHMILAQEFVTSDSFAPGEMEHNQHGPINSSSVIMTHGEADLSDPRTNVYAVQGSSFILIYLR